LKSVIGGLLSGGVVYAGGPTTEFRDVDGYAMHASHLDPRLLIASLAALVVTLILVLAPSLPEIELGFGSGGSAAPSLAAPAAPAEATGEPRWVTAPMRPPTF
jgi:hypothetical protein